MRLLLTVILLLSLTACVTTPPQDNGYLPMPEEFLGYWRPRGRASGIIGIDVRPDGIIEHRVNNDTKELVMIQYYKVFHIENGYVYTIVREEDTDPNSTLINPRWKYVRYIIDPPHTRPDNTVWVTYQHCDLFQKDWYLPAHIHWERLQNETNNVCEYNRNNLFHNLSTYTR